MARALWTRVLAVLLVVAIGLMGIVFLSPNVQAAVWTQTNDADFNAGTLGGVEVLGTGAAAKVELLRDATDWMNKIPATNPGAREGPAMAWDSANGVAVAFGGYTGINNGDTWEYTPGTNTWAQTAVTGPSGRAYSGIAYDSLNAVTVLFGGVSDLGFEADTWEYNAVTNTWTQTTPATSPPPMASYHLAYVSSQQRVLLFGMNVGTSLMETWAYDAAADAWVDRGPAAQPGVRTNHGMAYHATLDRVVLFGGFDPFPPPGTILDETWEYTWGANTWTQITPAGPSPSGRVNHGMSWRPSGGAVFLFGGSSGGPLADTWRYFDVGGMRNWVSTPTQRNPSARSMFGFTDETASGESLLYGGTGAGGVRSPETWALGPAYRASGTFESQTWDSQGANVNWNWIAWNLTSQPAGTVLRFHLASSNSPTGPWSFVGPTGTVGLYYTVSPTTIWTGHDGERYLRVRGYFLSSINLNTPSMEDFTIDYTVPASDPYLVFTDPVNTELGVPFTDPIFIRFSEPMNTASVTVSIVPSLTTTRTWTEANSALTLDHAAPMLECRAYTVTVTAALDVAGNPLNNGLNLVPNPFSFVSLCDPPEVIATNPSQGAVDVPLAAPVIVTFSEAMDTATVTWNVTPAITTSGAWSGGDAILTISHVADFQQCTMYTVTVAGKDLAGQDLLPGPAPNPFDFMTLCTIPFIVTTSPYDLETNIAPTANVVVEFSEPIVPSSMAYTSSPAFSFTPTWTNNNKTLTFSHGTPFSACTMFTFRITAAKDVDGNDLWPGQHAGHAMNPWKFAVQCVSPFLVFTVPWDGMTGVNQSADIVIQFSEAMNTASVVVDIVPPLVLVPSWTGMNQILILNHTLPFACGTNTVTVTGLDPDGNSLVPGLAANPFSFVPTCPDPFITVTDPAADETNVALTRPIVITFSETMVPASVLYDVFPAIATTPSWTANNTVLTLNHAAPFNQSTQYTVLVLAGQDLDGNNLIAGPAPNPWRFTTVGVNPFVVSTDPVHGATDVPLGANVIITFSESMDAPNVTVTPNPSIFLAYSWSVNDTVLILSHFTAFAECRVYAFTVAGDDLNGDPLVVGPVPNPFSFTTICFAPFITNTNPADGAVQVPVLASIWVNFSEPMDTAQTSASLAPFLALTYAWSNGDQTLEIRHAIPFTDCQLYQVTVTGRDTSGNTLVAGPVPNPWSFRAFCPAPYIVSTVPADGATNVPTTTAVVVTFSKAMDTATVTVQFTPGATVTRVWTAGDTILTLTPSPAFLDCTNYQVLIAGKDTFGTDLVPGPVPNPWTFSTACIVTPPTNLRATKAAPDIVRLTWNPVAGADFYRVYSSLDRFAAWPWAVLGTTVAPTFDAGGHQTDGLTHFYIVRSVRVATVSTNSTMAAKIDRQFGFSAAGTNVHWFSLPYRSQYATASDIANELGPTRIDVVGKWNPATQSSILYYWFRGAWRGTNFPIAAGDGLFLGAVSPFNWVIVGTDRAVTLSFTLNAPPLPNVNWISLPYGTRYTDASDLVVDIEGGTTGADNTFIIEVVKWDSATQTTVRFYWLPGGWTGTDFTLSPGDGLYFRIVSSFTWPVDLLTPEVP